MVAVLDRHSRGTKFRERHRARRKLIVLREVSDGLRADRLAWRGCRRGIWRGCRCWVRGGCRSDRSSVLDGPDAAAVCELATGRIVQVDVELLVRLLNAVVGNID